MLTFMVLLHYGSSERPSLQLVEGPDDSGAQDIADEMLRETRDGVGVEVWRGKHRIHARGVVPPRKSPRTHPLAGRITVLPNLRPA